MQTPRVHSCLVEPVTLRSTMDPRGGVSCSTLRQLLRGNDHLLPSLIVVDEDQMASDFVRVCAHAHRRFP